MSDVRPYLDQDPPPWAAHALGWFVLGLAAIALAASILVQVPETVHATFTLVPQPGADPIRALRAGVVRDVRVRAGAPVAAGALLYTITTPDAADRTGELQGLERELSDADHRAANLRRAFQEQRAADEQERTRLESRLGTLATKIASQHRELALANDMLRRYRESHEKGLTAAVDLDRAAREVARLDTEIAESAAEGADLRGALGQLAREMAARDANWQEEARGVREARDRSDIRRGVLATEPDARGEQVLRAPCDGTILTVLIRQAGTAVADGDTLAELACTGETLQADLRIPQRGLGLLRVGQTVRLLYDAYPYERFGAGPATMTWVSPAGTDEGGQAFHAFAELHAGGPHGGSLGAGLSGDAEVIVGRRRLIAYALDPVRRLREDFK